MDHEKFAALRHKSFIVFDREVIHQVRRGTKALLLKTRKDGMSLVKLIKTKPAKTSARFPAPCSKDGDTVLAFSRTLVDSQSGRPIE